MELTAFIVGPLIATIGPEFGPRPFSADRFSEIFGYVQADVIAQYQPGILANTAKGRHFGAEASKTFGSSDRVRLEATPNGPRGYRVLIFYVFLGLSLLTHTLFVIVAFWMVYKIVFIWGLLSFTVSVATGRDGTRIGKMWRWLCGESISFKIDLEDRDNRFGLQPIISGLRFVFWLLVASGIVAAIALMETRNGVPETLIQNFRAPGGAAIIPIIIVGALAVLFVSLYRNLEAFREEEIQRIALGGRDFGRVQAQRVAVAKDLIPLSLATIAFYVIIPVLAPAKFKTTS